VFTECLLTFDDGPHPTSTSLILDILAEAKVSAVFFIVGARLKSSICRSLARRAVAAGHVLGNHTFSHPKLVGKQLSEVRQELQRTHDLICECAGSCVVFRPPYGAMDQGVTDIATEMGYKILNWNVDSLDWKLRADGEWVEHAITELGGLGKEVVLMHDIHISTAYDLPNLLTHLMADPTRKIANAAMWSDFLKLMNLPAANCGVSKTARNEASFGEFTLSD